MCVKDGGGRVSWNGTQNSRPSHELFLKSLTGVTLKDATLLLKMLKQKNSGGVSFFERETSLSSEQ